MKPTIKIAWKESIRAAALTITFVVCGGNKRIPNLPALASHARVFVKPQPGTGMGHNSSPTHAAMAFFQSSTPAPSTTRQSFNGYCQYVPTSGTGFEAYGLGLFDTNCISQWTNPSVQGPPVVDNGTL